MRVLFYELGLKIVRMTEMKKTFDNGFIVMPLLNTFLSSFILFFSLNLLHTIFYSYSSTLFCRMQLWNFNSFLFKQKHFDTLKFSNTTDARYINFNWRTNTNDRIYSHQYNRSIFLEFFSNSKCIYTIRLEVKLFAT